MSSRKRTLKQLENIDSDDEWHPDIDNELEVNFGNCFNDSYETEEESDNSDCDTNNEPPKKRSKLNVKNKNKKLTKHMLDGKIIRFSTGGGFSTAKKAMKLLEFMKGRELGYQLGSIKWMNRAAEILGKRAKTKEKKEHFKQAWNVFQEWMSNYRENEQQMIFKFKNACLELATIQKFIPLAIYYNSEQRMDEEIKCEANVFEIETNFVELYEQLHGKYQFLRVTNVDGSEYQSACKQRSKKKTWDILRNEILLGLKEQMLQQMHQKDATYFDWSEVDDCYLYYSRGKLQNMPSRIHLQMIFYGYSPHKQRVKKLSSSVESTLNNIL